MDHTGIGKYSQSLYTYIYILKCKLFSSYRKEICARLHRLDEKDCQSRYYFRKSVLKGFNFWTEAEEDLLRSLIAKYEGGKPNWKVISSQIPTRTTAAIKTHWRSIQKRNIPQDLFDKENSYENSKESECPNMIQADQSYMHRLPENFHSLFYNPYFMQQKAMNVTQIGRYDSEDSQMTYIPDADPNFGQSDYYEEVDTQDITGPSWKRIRSEDCAPPFSNLLQNNARDLIPLSYLPTIDNLQTMTTSCQTHSADITPSSSFIFHTTKNSDPFDPAIQENCSLRAIGSHLQLSSEVSFASDTADHTEEEDFVTTFIETFGNMDDEDTRFSPPDVASSTDQLATGREFCTDKAGCEHNIDEVRNEKDVPKRAITSWENAIKALPLRKEKRGNSETDESSCDRESWTRKSLTNGGEKGMSKLSFCKTSGKRKYSLKSGRRAQQRSTPNCFIDGEIRQFQEKQRANPNSMSMEVPSKLVYVPCVYSNTPNHIMAYTTSHPSMQGLRRPPPGFRLIQAPALVTSSHLSDVSNIPEQPCENHNPTSHGSIFSNFHRNEKQCIKSTDSPILPSSNHATY